MLFLPIPFGYSQKYVPVSINCSKQDLFPDRTIKPHRESVFKDNLYRYVTPYLFLITLHASE